jgi:hypothetical protein
MKKHFVLIVSLMLGLAAASALRISTHQGSSTGISNPSLDMNGAYRDGLFQGKQAAERHAPNMAPVGRWSRSTDRAAFAAGYEKGYSSLMWDEVARSDAR